MVMSKKRKGFSLLEVVLSTLFTAICVLALSKLITLDSQTRQDVDYSISHSESKYIGQMLFADIKAATQINCAGTGKLNLYSENVIVNYTIDDGYFYRNNEILCECTGGAFDVSGNSVFIAIKGELINLNLRVTGGD